MVCSNTLIQHSPYNSLGELEFGDLPIETGIGYIYLLGFVFLIVVVLMNLLNGLAVSDTGVIR